MISKHNIKTIQKLRTKGYSIPEISQNTTIPKTTVFRYVRDIKINEKFISRWENRKKGSRILSDKERKRVLEIVNKEILSFNNETQKIICALLYWAEGAKKDFSFANTDPEMVKLFVNCLKRQFGISDKDIKVSIRIYGDMDGDECINYWSEVSGVKQVNKFKLDVQNGKKNGKLKYGMCRVRVNKPGFILKYFNETARRLVELNLTA